MTNLREWADRFDNRREEHPPVRPPAPAVVQAKSPGAAAVVGWLVPGVGNMMSGRMGKGLLILASLLVSWLLTVVVIGWPLVILMHIGIGPVTAYNDARRWNARHGIIS